MAEWTYTKYGDVISIKSRKSSNNIALDYKCIEMENIQQETGKILGYVDISKQKSIKNLFNKGDVLFGKLRPYLKKFARPNFDGACSSEIWVLSSKSKALINDYLYLLVQSSQFQEYANNSTGSKMPRADWSFIAEKDLILPPLPEQKKIAEILSTWDEAIETNKKLLKSIEEYRAKQLKNCFIKMESTIVPMSLEKLENNGFIKLGRGRVISKDEMKSSKGLFPVYSSSIKNNGLMGYIDEYLFDEEMITWSVDGGGNFFYRDKHKFSVTNVSGFMRIIDENIRPYFLVSQLQYLHSKLVFDYQTKAHPSVIRSLYKVQIPTLNEQTRFESLFKSIDKQIEKINQYINELQRQKQGLMQRLLTGKVRVKLD